MTTRSIHTATTNLSNTMLHDRLGALLELWQQQYQQQPTIMLVNIGIDSYWHDQVIIDQQWWCFVVRF